ncbi:xanthine dehydrogenase/oxidase-like [Crocuta crocuta]
MVPERAGNLAKANAITETYFVQSCLALAKPAGVILSPSLFNPEEFMPLDPTQEPIFPPELLRLKDTPQKQLRFEGERVTWIQASTLQELLDLKAQFPEAKLVVGNTEIGIEMKFKNKLFPMIVCPAWIPELNSVEHGPEGISFGASCPLSLVEKTLVDAVAKLCAYKTEVFKGVLEQLRWFAGKQVKSVASIGGNIITASPISDLNTVFMASGAKLTIVSTVTPCVVVTHVKCYLLGKLVGD